MKTNFHNKHFNALSLAFIMRFTVTRKWPAEHFQGIWEGGGGGWALGVRGLAIKGSCEPTRECRSEQCSGNSSTRIKLHSTSKDL